MDGGSHFKAKVTVSRSRFSQFADYDDMRNRDTHSKTVTIKHNLKALSAQCYWR